MKAAGIARTLDSLFRQWQEDLEYAPEFLQDLAYSIILPLMVALALTWACLRCFRITYRIVFPPSAEQLHKEALGHLKKGHGKDARSAAKKLLQKSIRRYPSYLESYLALIVLQLYEEDSPDDALKTIDSGLSMFPKNQELRQMRLDAMAMKENLGHMVKVGGFGLEHIGEEGWRPMDGASNSSSLKKRA